MKKPLAILSLCLAVAGAGAGTAAAAPPAPADQNPAARSAVCHVTESATNPPRRRLRAGQRQAAPQELRAR